MPNLTNKTKCKTCGQPLPKQLDKKTLEHMDRMLKVWIALLMRDKE